MQSRDKPAPTAYLYFHSSFLIGAIGAYPSVVFSSSFWLCESQRKYPLTKGAKVREIPSIRRQGFFCSSVQLQ